MPVRFPNDTVRILTDIPSWMLLLIAVGALVVAPLLGRPLARGTVARAGLDAFVVFGVASLVFLHVLPELFEQVGLLSIALVALGLVAARILDAGTGDRPAPVVTAGALGALALHTALDGAALASGHESLGVAIVLHRLPIGLLAWSLVSTRFQGGAAWLALGSLGVTTALGYVFAAAFVGSHAPILAAIQASVAGALLHVLIRQGRAEQNVSSSARVAGVGGAALGVGLLAVLPGHADVMAGYGHRFLGLLLASAPALVVGYLLAGALTMWVPKTPLRWLGGGSTLRQAAGGVLFGLPLPICSCGVVPVYHGMVRRGMPAAAGFSFLVATPELGIESVVLSLPLLGGELTALRIAAAFLVALTVGLVAARFVSSKPAPFDQAASGPRSVRERLRGALVFGLGEVVETTSPWILLGLAVAAVFDEGQVASWVSVLPRGAEVVAAALLGLPMYVCASGATPLAAALIFAGISPGAAVAFLLSGPATNVTTFGVLKRLFDRRLAIVFGATVVGMSVAVGVLINQLLPTVSGVTVPPHPEHAEWWQWGSLTLLSLVVGAAILRRGVFGFVREVTGPRHEDHGVPQACNGDDCGTADEASLGSFREPGAGVD